MSLTSSLGDIIIFWIIQAASTSKLFIKGLAGLQALSPSKQNRALKHNSYGLACEITPFPG